MKWKKYGIYAALIIVLVAASGFGIVRAGRYWVNKVESNHDVPDTRVSDANIPEETHKGDENQGNRQIENGKDDLKDLKIDETDTKSITEEYQLTEEDGAEDITGELSPDSSFEIHYFDVGEADSALVECDGQTLLIDGGNPKSSQFLYAYLEQNEINYIDYMVCTHAHEDHVGGLAGALNYAQVGKAFAPVAEYDSRAFNSYVKYLNQQGKEITGPLPGECFMLGSAEVTILAPIDMSLAENNINNSSIVLRIIYGSTSFIFTGDAEEAEEKTILEVGYELESTVLKVGHHGSQTSTSEEFLDKVAPKYCVISVGKDNQYEHPSADVIQRLQSIDAIIYRTDINGEIICYSNGKNVSFKTEK